MCLTWTTVLILPVTSYVHLGKLLNLSVETILYYLEKM